jgi:hypothetical protein
MSRGATVLSIAASELRCGCGFWSPRDTRRDRDPLMKFDFDQIIGGEIEIDGAATLRAVPKRIIR